MPNQSKSCFFSPPGHNARDNQKSDWQSWTSADHEKMRQNGSDHDRNKKKSADPRESRNQEQNRRGEFDERSHVTKPLADADGVESLDHLFIPRQFRKSYDEEQGRCENLNHPKSSISGCFQAGRIGTHKDPVSSISLLTMGSASAVPLHQDLQSTYSQRKFGDTD